MDKKIKALAKKIVDVTHRAPEKKTYAYDTQATITRIDGDIAWVHIPGGVTETPVKLTIQASTNDKVMVRLADGDAWITGNKSAPPTDDKVAKEAKDEVDNLSKELVDIQENLSEQLVYLLDGKILLDTDAASGVDYNLTTILSDFGWLDDVTEDM